MCGIIGYLNLENQPIEKSVFDEMRDSIKHRGPDDSGTLFLDKVALGSRRLSILDLSKRGHQPMSDESGDFSIVFNGEVYNYIEIREELKKKGYKFRSKTDTEVVLNSYIEWGEKALDKFNGDFAFAIWNKKSEELFVARDRFGVKPLYYHFDGKKFIFASEIRAILKSGKVKKEANNKAILTYLKTSIVDGIEETFFKDIKRLAPSHFIKITNKNITIKRYWNIHKESYKNKEKTFKELFENSVKLRLRSDVPLGVCLSGGLDSSSIFAALSQLNRGKSKTFSAFFNFGEEFDERKFFNLVVEKFKAESYKVEVKKESLFDDINQIIWHLEEPPRATGVFPQWNVIKLAKNKAKVLLDGQGADELLAGYNRYYKDYLIELLKNFKFVKFYRENKNIKKITGKSFAKEALTYLVYNLPVVRIAKEQAKRLVTPSYSVINSNFNKVYNQTIKKPQNSFINGRLDNQLYQDFYLGSLPELLKYEDKIGLAFSIETRVPFLDHNLVNFVFNLNSSDKIYKGWTKYILRKSMPELPEEIRWRKDKKGFPTPIKELLSGESRKIVEKLLFDGTLAKRNIFDMDKMRELFKKQCNGDMDISSEIWKWICLEIWFRTFID